MAKKEMRVCKNCGGKYYAKGLCEDCYNKEYWKRPLVKSRRSAYRKEYRQRPKIRARRQKYWLSPKVKARKKELYHSTEAKIKRKGLNQKPRIKYSRYKRTAKKKRLCLNIPFNKFKELIQKPCYYCGFTEKIGLDRIDNNKGYLITNVVPCCALCNYTRNKNYTKEEFMLIGQTIKKIRELRKMTE